MNTPTTQLENDWGEFHEEWLSAYLDGELNEEQRQVVEARLAEDAGARELLSDLERVRGLVRQLPAWPGAGLSSASILAGTSASTAPEAPSADPLKEALPSEPRGESLADSLTEPLQSRRSRPRPAAWMSWLRPLAVAASLLLALGLGFLWWPGTSPWTSLASRNVPPAGAAADLSSREADSAESAAEPVETAVAGNVEFDAETRSNGQLGGERFSMRSAEALPPAPAPAESLSLEHALGGMVDGQPASESVAGGAAAREDSNTAARGLERVELKQGENRSAGSQASSLSFGASPAAPMIDLPAVDASVDYSPPADAQPPSAASPDLFAMRLKVGRSPAWSESEVEQQLEQNEFLVAMRGGGGGQRNEQPSARSRQLDAVPVVVAKLPPTPDVTSLFSQQVEQLNWDRLVEPDGNRQLAEYRRSPDLQHGLESRPLAMGKADGQQTDARQSSRPETPQKAAQADSAGDDTARGGAAGLPGQAATPGRAALPGEAEAEAMSEVAAGSSLAQVKLKEAVVLFVTRQEARDVLAKLYAESPAKAQGHYMWIQPALPQASTAADKQKVILLLNPAGE